MKRAIHPRFETFSLLTKYESIGVNSGMVEIIMTANVGFTYDMPIVSNRKYPKGSKRLINARMITSRRGSLFSWCEKVPTIKRRVKAMIILKNIKSVGVKNSNAPFVHTNDKLHIRTEVRSAM